MAPVFPDRREPVRLVLVGEFTVCRSGSAQHPARVGSRKARTLLALLAVRPRRLVPVDRIADVLWAGARPRRPADNVATLVSRLRAALGADAVVGGRAGYRLGDAVRVDLYDAAALITAAEARLVRGAPLAALAVGRHALALVDDAVLADQPEADWAEPARAAQAGLLRRARHAVAAAALGAGEPQAAAAAAEAAIAGDPFDEAAHRLLMRAYDAAGEPARALLAYERLRRLLAAELGVDPAPPTRDVHAWILRRNGR